MGSHALAELISGKQMESIPHLSPISSLTIQLIPLPTPSPHIQLAPRFLEHPAHLFHALERRGLAGGGRLCAGGAGGEEAFDALVLLVGEGADFLADLH